MSVTGTYKFTAVLPGASGNGIQVSIPDNSGMMNIPLSLVVAVHHITITPATDGSGNIISTTSDVANLIATTPSAAALVTTLITLAGITPTGSVVLGGGSGTATTGSLRAIGVKIKDWNGKYYMNDYVPLDLIFGFDNSQTPGLLYPEIYIPRQQNIFFDLVALPSGGSLSGVVTLTEKGQKVYA